MLTSNTYELDDILIHESKKPLTLKQYPEELYFLDVFDRPGDDGPHRKVLTHPSEVALTGYVCILNCRHDKNKKTYAVAIMQKDPEIWIQEDKRSAAYELQLSIKCDLISQDFIVRNCLVWWSHKHEPKILTIDDNHLNPDHLLLFYTDLPLLVQRIEYSVLNTSDLGFILEISGSAIPLLRLERFALYNRNRRNALVKRQAWDARVAEARKNILNFAQKAQIILLVYSEKASNLKKTAVGLGWLAGVATFGVGLLVMDKLDPPFDETREARKLLPKLNADHKNTIVRLVQEIDIFNSLEVKDLRTYLKEIYNKPDNYAISISEAGYGGSQRGDKLVANSVVQALAEIIRSQTG